MFLKLIRVILIIFLISSCGLLQDKGTTILSLKVSEEILSEPIYVKYVNGKINYVITFKSNNSLILLVNGTTNIIPEIPIERIIFSNNPKRFLIIGVKNDTKYVFLNNKLIGKYKDLDEIFFSKNGNIITIQNESLKEFSKHINSNISFSIIQKGSAKYILTSDGKEFGPFTEVETPFQTIDLQNWWIVGKVNHSNYTLIINGIFRLDNLQDIGIPYFYETNFILTVKISNSNYLVVNGKLLPHPLKNLEQTTIHKKTWLAIEKSITNRIIGENITKTNIKTLYTTTNRILNYLYDNYDNVWILEEYSNKIFLIKNFKFKEGIFDEVYPYTFENGEVAFVYRISNEWFLNWNRKTFGPFESVGEVSLVSKKITFYFTLNNQNYLQIGNQKLGPYNKILNLSIKENVPILFFEDNGKEFISIGNQKTLGPYERIYWNTLSYKNGKFLFVFEDKNQMYINYSSKVYGPFKNVYMPVLSEDGSMWGAGIMSYDNTFSLIFNGKIIGNYINVDYESIKLDSNNGRWGGITQKQDGFYITTSFSEFGPFERVFQLQFSEDLKKAKFSAKKDNQIFIFFTDKDKIKKILGPFNMAVFASKDFYNNLIVIQSNKDYYIYNNTILGPYKYIKEISERNNHLYFIYHNGRNEVLNINHKTIIEIPKIIRYKDFIRDWYVVAVDKTPKVITKTNSLEVFISKEELMNDKKFFWILKNNEWQYIIVDGEEIGYFNHINPESFLYDYKNNTFGVIGRKGDNFYLITSKKIFGPHKDILKFRILNNNTYLYLVKDTTTSKLYINDKVLEEGVLDFDIDYKRENITFIIKLKNKIEIRTLKVSDLRHHQN